MSSQLILLNNNQIHYINPSCHISLLNEIIALVQQTRYFTIEGKFDYNVPNIIIELIHKQKSIILIIKVDRFLFNTEQDQPLSLYRWLLRSLFFRIFDSRNVIYTWGNYIQSATGNIIDLQQEFKFWYSIRYQNLMLENYQWNLSQAALLTFNQVPNRSIIFESCLATTKLAHLMQYDIGCMCHS